MKHFKKRTLALVLASVITVAGSFASGNYKNSLMSLQFETSESGAVSMAVETKTAYNGNISPVRKDANTYMLTLSEMDSKIQGMPNLEKVSDNISSVEIKTLPYTNNAKGYTRILIKTYNPINIQAENKIYIPSKDYNHNNKISYNNYDEYNRNSAYNYQEEERVRREQFNAEMLRREQEAKALEQRRQQQSQIQQVEQPQSNNYQESDMPTAGYMNVPNTDKSFNTPAEKDPYKVMLTVFIVLFLFGFIGFLSMRASHKIQEVTGERFNIDTSDDDDELKPKKGSKRKKIKNTINKLDADYSKSAVRTKKSVQPQAPIKTVKPSEELNVLDLDELFKEQQEKTQEEVSNDEPLDSAENDALADFLSGFSFNEDEFTEEQPENETPFNENLYNEILANNNIKFTNNDLDCIKQLLNKEIDDKTLDNLSDFIVSNPIVSGRNSKEKILENLIATYKISQDISFSSEDISILRKLISVEIDNDFITDLRTNPERTLEMQKEIEASANKSHKPSEILTLKVKDVLPNLSEALRQQGNKRIESEVKPITVYASEGYEYTTLSLDDELPDLSIEINNESAYVSKPSADWERVDTGWDVETLKLTDSLPDLNEALKHPEDYENKKEETSVADEKTLLKNISNVNFKPFYDGSETFEVLNNFEDINEEEVKNEFNEFENFEITSEKDEEPEYTSNYEAQSEEENVISDNISEDIPESEIENNTEIQSVTESTLLAEEEVKDEAEKSEGIQLNTMSTLEDITEKTQKDAEDKIKGEFVPHNLERKKQENLNHTVRIKTDTARSIFEKIEKTKAERLERKNRVLQNHNSTKTVSKSTETKPADIKCIIDGETYTVISTTEFKDNKGCHLARKENGYVVLGYIGNKFIKLKEFDNLKSERITSRLSESLAEGVKRYIVRVGLNKFIVNVTENNLEYLMAL